MYEYEKKKKYKEIIKIYMIYIFYQNSRAEFEM